MADRPRPDLKKELNQLWKSTVDQLDELKDVIVKSSQAGKARLDEAVLGRDRDQKLKELGELVLKSDPGAPLPDAWQAKITEIRELDGQIAAQRREFDGLVQDVKEAMPDVASVMRTASGPEPSDEDAEADDGAEDGTGSGEAEAGGPHEPSKP